MIVLGWCALPKGHLEQCAIRVETKSISQQEVLDMNFNLDLDLDDPYGEHDACDTWKPGRDIPPV